MLRQDPNRRKSSPDVGGSPNHNNRAMHGEANRIGGVDIQQELNKLEEMILDSPRIPLSRRTMIDEEQLLDQLDLVRLSLPAAFQEASEIIQHKEEILIEAEQYAQEIIADAERRAAQIMDEMGILRQAEMEAQHIRREVQRECEEMQQQVLTDIEQVRRRAQQEFEEMQRMTIAECEEIQRGADIYADGVLRDMEQQLNDMMRIVRNGRQQIQTNASANRIRSPQNSSDRLPPSQYQNW